MEKDKVINLPNLLSFYRILVFPLILWFIFNGHEALFAVFIIINLFTDVLDGFIARAFNLQTEFGARIDSIGDMGTYTLAFLGLFTFKLDELMPHITPLIIFIVLCIALVVISLVKFGRLPAFHMYSWKIGGYIQGAFFFTLFVFDFYAPLYYFMIIWAIIAALEHIAVQIAIPELYSNVKGLYWVLKNRNN